MGKLKKRILSVWVEDKTGVLGRVTQLFGEQHCNIESLAVGSTERPGISRMTIIVGGEDESVDTVLSQLNRITNLIKVTRIDSEESVLMELALVMVDAPDERKTDLINLVNVFRARIVDVATSTMTIAASGNPGKLQALIDLLRPFGILEIVRTGLIAMDRGNKSFN